MGAEHVCQMCRTPVSVRGLCQTCGGKVRRLLAEYEQEAQALAKDPVRNRAGFGAKAILAAMIRQSGWSHYFQYVQAPQKEQAPSA